MTAMIEHKDIDIYVEMYWELRSKEYDDKKVTDREYVDKYHGGYTITSCPGFPSINGGFGTPDMMACYPTVKSLKDKLFSQYAERYPEHKVTVHINVTKDDRNPTMDSFF